jgi:hypothetical protein
MLVNLSPEGTVVIGRSQVETVDGLVLCAFTLCIDSNVTLARAVQSGHAMRDLEVNDIITF